jgi:hypothetical protein
MNRTATKIIDSYIASLDTMKAETFWFEIVDVNVVEVDCVDIRFELPVIIDSDDEACELFWTTEVVLVVISFGGTTDSRNVDL